MKLRETSERLIVYRRYDDSPHYLQQKVVYVFATKFVADKFVLDDGSGSGHGSYYLITNGAGRVVGIDISEDATAYAKERYNHKNLEFMTMRATNLSFPDETFDVVTSFQVIEHIADVTTFLYEIRRVLKTAGIALVSTPNKKTFSPNTSESKSPFHVKEFVLDEFAELLSRYFEEVEILGLHQSVELAEFRKSVERSLRKRFEKFLKRVGLLPAVQRIIPKEVRYFFSKRPGRSIDLSEFSITNTDLDTCLDFVAICRKT